jgi:glycosyltransferase involved in cell wall biosynthesis
MTKRLRVGFVLAALRPGGAERQMLALATRLPRDRFEVDFLSLSGEGEYDAQARSAGARVIHIGPPRHPGMSLAQTINIRVTKLASYARAVRRGRYDILDVWLYPSDVLALAMRPLTWTPVIMSGRRNLDPHDRFRFAEPLVDRLTNALVDAVVANSAAAGEHAIRTQRVDPSKLRVIRNGVELVDPPSPEERSAFRRSLGVPDDAFLIGCVANYQPVKGHSTLIDAFSNLTAASTSPRLILVGEGPTRSALERQVAQLGLRDRVLLHGSALDPRPFYGAFDLVVQASLSEGLPNVLLEAAAAGRPIVATAAGGSTEIVIDGETGLLVPVGDRDALASGMRRALDDPALRDRLGAAARRHIESAFGMDRFVSEFASLYEELIERKARRARREGHPAHLW